MIAIALFSSCWKEKQLGDVYRTTMAWLNPPASGQGLAKVWLCR
jgi:hypothetical protein